MRSIYLDNNATTALHPEVASVMQHCYQDPPGNPSSQHAEGRRARKRIETARDALSSRLGAVTAGTLVDQLLFTSGGTEANNLAIRGLAGSVPGRVIVSVIEHPSVLGAAEHLRHIGFEICQLPVDANGVVRLELLPQLLTPTTRLVSVMLGNNETGVLQPVAEIARLASARGVPVHTDAVQAVGKIPVHFRELGVAALTFSAHKFHGPVGIGGLLLRQGVSLSPILFGGFQQGGLRPGTETVALAVGMQQALQVWQREADPRRDRLVRLRDRLAARLRAGSSRMVIPGEAADRLPHTLNVAFPGVDRQALAMALDLAGVACSTGSACASGSSEPSPVLLAMGVPGEVVRGAIRLSLSVFTTESDVDEAADRILKIVNDLQQIESPGRNSQPARNRQLKAI